MEKLLGCLTKLEPLKTRSFDDFEQDSYLRDIVERNLEVAAKCCIDIANRVIALEDMEKPHDYYGAFIILGQSGILPLKFARSFAGIAGFRNILIHEYIQIDWSEVYCNLQKLDDLYKFADSIKTWMKSTLAE